MLNLLSIIIGIVFVILLFSLLATTIMEMLAGLLTLRGKNLINAIRSMLGDEETNIFTSHPYYQQLGERANLFRFFRKKPLPPSYIRPGTFTSILMDTLQVNSTGEIKQVLDGLPDGKMKEVLKYHYRESAGNIATFRQKTEDWFNEVTERSKEWYANNIRIWLIYIGFTIAVVFNVDVINIYSTLSTNATLREFVANSATEFVQTQPAPKPIDSIAIAPDFNAARGQMKTLLNENIAAIQSPLGLGWDYVVWPAPGEETQWWIYKLIGWLITALAVSKGADFWFNLLKQLVSFRSGGTSAQAQAPTPVPAPPPAEQIPAPVFRQPLAPPPPADVDFVDDTADG